MTHRFSHITGRVHKAYRPNFKELDQTFDMDLTAKVVYGQYRAPDTYDGSSRQRIWITFNRPVSRQEAHDAAYDMFERGGCHHEYDCCGCSFGGARTLERKNKSGRKWTAVLSFARNY
jgi:hypothetical protein